MSRLLTVLLLSLGLLAALGGVPTLTSVAHAQEGWKVLDPEEPTVENPTEPVTPDGTAPSGTTEEPTEPTTPQKPVLPEIVKHVVPTKESILGQLQKDTAEDAEASYLEWTGIWHEDDPELLGAIEHQILAKQAATDPSLFLNMLSLGDADALTKLRAQLRDGKCSLTGDQQAVALRALATHGTNTDLPLLLTLLESKDAATANNAIDALGYLRNRDAIEKLYAMAPFADLGRMVRIARAVSQISSSHDVSQRYTYQLDFPLPNIPERASLVLCLSGNPSGWTLVRQMLESKDKAFYPLALSVLGNLPVEGVEQYVLAGLQGNEQEQLAALQSIDALPAEQIDGKLNEMMLDGKRTMRVRLLAVDLLSQRYTTTAQEFLQAVASDESMDVALRTPATIAVASYGGLDDESVRGLFYQQLLSEDAKLVKLARIALYCYATQNNPLAF